MEFVWIRHGMTKGNKEKRYIGGRTDEPLCEEGRKKLREKAAAGVYPHVEKVYVSPMIRCLETADIIYPHVEKQIVPGFRECDFGLFENKNYKEMADLPAYQAWIDGNGKEAFPQGEHPEAFNRRSLDALLALAEAGELAERSAFVVHGGTIMAVCSQLDAAKKEYYDYHVENGCGYFCEAERTTGGLMFRELKALG
ncbi:MAG: histidine phosphatase family protein [Lachnospiraceae bacterium]|nr:histidine phosphatase family protein [Lachnospiraceae bacterium]